LPLGGCEPASFEVERGADDGGENRAEVVGRSAELVGGIKNLLSYPPG
jgi:hypothetical protein